jgi:hypothetical protein
MSIINTTKRARGGRSILLALVITIGMSLAAAPASAHRSAHGGQYPHTAGTTLYLPYTMTANGYNSATNSAMYAWYNTPTRVWPYQTTDYNNSKVDVYTGSYAATWWGLAVNNPCSACWYSWTDIYLNTRTMNPESAFTRQGIVVHEVGHALGLSHVCGEAMCPPGSTPTIMQWGRLPYNTPRTHDITDINAIYR